MARKHLQGKRFIESDYLNSYDLRYKNSPTSVAAMLFLGLFYDSIKEFTTAQIDEVPLAPSKPRANGCENVPEVMDSLAKRVLQRIARWKRQDKKLASKVDKIALRLKTADGKPARITLSTLLSR